MSEREAIAWMDHTEQERSAFLRGNFGVDPADPLLYDLVLNTARLSVPECVDVILEAYARVEHRAMAQNAV